jgi:RNA polymerase sigma-70 factor (ECF subfamily)
LPVVLMVKMHRVGDSDDEKIWLAQSRNGDHAAFAALIRKYQPMIHSLTFRMTGSVADCKDLAQESFIRAYQQLDSYQGTSKFSSWLYRIAVNACLDWRRRETRRSRLYTDWSEANAAEQAGVDSGAETDELSRQVQAALMKLPDKQRAAIVLTVYAGRNHAEAGRILGCSETTVSWRIFAARRKLKKLLSKQGGGHE